MPGLDLEESSALMEAAKEGSWLNPLSSAAWLGDVSGGAVRAASCGLRELRSTEGAKVTHNPFDRGCGKSQCRDWKSNL